MGAIGEQLASKFEASNGQLISKVESMSDAEWAKPTASEGWPAGVTAHHVAESLGSLTGLIQTVAQGGELPPVTMDMLNAGNAEHATRAANVTREETAALLRSNGEAAAKMLRSVSDADYARTGQLPAMGAPMSAQQFAENVLIAHVERHGASIRG